MTPIRCYAVEMVSKTETTPVLLTFDADEAEALVLTLNEVRLQHHLDGDDESELGPIAVCRKALLLYQPCPRERKEVLA